MRRFALLALQLGTSTKTNDRLEALHDYFQSADDADKVWVIALFSGRRPRRTVTTTQLWEWCRELTGLPAWLFEESYHTVGDLAETIALLLPGDGAASGKGESLAFYLERLMRLGSEDDAGKKAFILGCWATMNKDERFVFNKLITGGFRIGISQQTVVNALARATGAEASVVAHRISGDWDPSSTAFETLLSGAGEDLSRPYPFYLAYALEEALPALGHPDEWQAEWKWDGIRGQLIRRNADGRPGPNSAAGPVEEGLFLWSRGEELITDKFPEYQAFRALLPEGTVLDGEIIGLGSRPEGELPFVVLPFAALQTRIGRKNVTKKHLNEVPVGFIAYDLLEYGGEDWRGKPLEERRRRLEAVVTTAAHHLLRLSPIIPFDDWDRLAEIRTAARDHGSEGIMLKRKTSVYQVGRKRGNGGSGRWIRW
ncbi:MAG TPA: hypothetical protein VHE54_12790 [Puia sp.]|nr:hypothetical protein [Puia sp.]